MKYKLVNVTRVNAEENFDQKALIGEIFSIRRIPREGEGARMNHGMKCLCTTTVASVEKRKDWFQITTKNTIYEFERVKT